MVAVGAEPPQRATWMWAAASRAEGEGGSFLPLSVALLAECNCCIRHQGTHRLMRAGRMGAHICCQVHTRKSRGLTPAKFLARLGHWKQLFTKTDLEEAPARLHLPALLTSQRLGTFP